LALHHKKDVFSMLYLVVNKYTKGDFTNTELTVIRKKFISFKRRSRATF
jgi:hypothetical protein